LTHEEVDSMSLTTLHSAAAPAPAGAYSQVRRIGPFVQISGHVAQHVTPDVEAQTVQVLEQIRAVRAEEGLGWQDVLMMRVFLADDDYWAGMDAAYRRVVPQPYPPRTTASVGLGPKLLVEIDALAVIS
jgi:enamine deaminase RidA (YjgF/YER057c/UK114 family)